MSCKTVRKLMRNLTLVVFTDLRNSRHGVGKNEPHTVFHYGFNESRFFVLYF